MNFELTEADVMFFESKGFDVKTSDGLRKALKWLRTTDADNLMFGEPTGDPFDIEMGELRRPMLIAACEKALENKKRS